MGLQNRCPDEMVDLMTRGELVVFDSIAAVATGVTSHVVVSIDCC